MKIKNLTEATLTFSTGVTLGPFKTIDIPNATWAYLLNDEQVKSWLAAGILELNGTLPPPPPGTPILGAVVITQEDYDAIEVPDPKLAYYISVPE